MLEQLEDIIRIIDEDYYDDDLAQEVRVVLVEWKLSLENDV